MSHLDFTALSIDFTENDKASVYYAHLQNIFKELYLNHLEKKYSDDEALFKKIDQVLHDVYFEHLKLQKDYFNVSKNLKQMLEECTSLVNECKTDRQQLVKVTEDRQAILQKLKQSTNQSLQMMKQNEMLHYQLDKMKEINLLINQKNGVLEEQVLNAATNNKGYENIVSISKEFERISNNNVEIQKDISDILKSTQIYASASEPLQIMCLAFQEKPCLRQQFWDGVAEKHKNKFQDIQRTKTNFFNFSYIDALMLFSK